MLPSLYKPIIINCSKKSIVSVFALTLCETKLSAEDRSLKRYNARNRYAPLTEKVSIIRFVTGGHIWYTYLLIADYIESLNKGQYWKYMGRK